LAAIINLKQFKRLHFQVCQGYLISKKLVNREVPNKGNNQREIKIVQRWNLKNLSRDLNLPKPGLN